MNDTPAPRIRQGWLQSISNLDPDLSLLHRDQDKRAVIASLLSKLPGAGHFMRILFQLLLFQRGNNENRHLSRIFRLEFLELRFQGADLFLGKNAGQIRDAGLQLGNVEGERSMAEQNQQCQRNPQGARSHA